VGCALRLRVRVYGQAFWMVAMTEAPEERLRCVMCEACGGTGEIIRSRPVGPYQEPDEWAELCSACGGYGRDYEDDTGDCEGPCA
jgi:DnaJ-class molecular chaperone